MKVMITGAAGKLGSQTVSELQASDEDWQIVAVDKRARCPVPFDWDKVDLRDEEAVNRAMSGVEAIVHLGNYSGPGWGTRRSHATTFNENMAMDYNVFDAAAKAGARKIVFASSVQVVASERNDPEDPPHAHTVAYLPLDDDNPANPTNCYALSKHFGEQLLGQFFAAFGIQCASLRFPALRRLGEKRRPRARRRHTPRSKHLPVRIAQAFSYLSYRDAARAVLAVLRSDLPGHRVYLPALSRITGDKVPAAIEKHYPNVPLKRPIEQIDSLVDISRIQQDTGWKPQRYHHPAGRNR